MNRIVTFVKGIIQLVKGVITVAGVILNVGKAAWDAYSDLTDPIFRFLPFVEKLLAGPFLILAATRFVLYALWGFTGLFIYVFGFRVNILFIITTKVWPMDMWVWWIVTSLVCMFIGIVAGCGFRKRKTGWFFWFCGFWGIVSGLGWATLDFTPLF